MMRKVAAAVTATVLVAGVATLAYSQPAPAPRAAAPAVQQARPLDVEAYAQAPMISGLRLADEGRKIVGLARVPGNTDTMGVAVWNVENLAAGPVITPPKNDMRFQSARPLKADKILIGANTPWTGNIGDCGGEGNDGGSSTKTWVNQDYITDFTMQRFDQPLRPRARSSDVQACINIQPSVAIVSSLPFFDDEVLVSTRDAELNAIYARYNLRTGRLTTTYRGSDDWGVALVDGRTGDILARNGLRTESNQTNTQIFQLRNPTTGQLEEHPALESPIRNRKSINIAGWDETTKKFYIITNLFSDKDRVYMYDPLTKKFDAEPAFAHPRFNASGVVLGGTKENFNKLLGFQYDGAAVETYWIDPIYANVDRALKQALPGRIINIVQLRDGGNQVLVQAESSRHPPAWYILKNQRELQLLGSERPWIDPNTLGETKLQYFNARDGLEVPVLVTLPAGYTKDKGRLPMIVVPHGGPWARDFADWDFSGWTQYFASRGYAVIQPQYRGSEGFGERLWKAGDREWGQKMQDDKDDAALWMVSEGIADRSRIAIHGYSYGGYAAFAAAVRPNGPNAGPFRCSIAGAGVANLARIKNELFGAGRLQREFQGDTVDGLDPQREVRNMNIPLLIYTGDRDVRVPPFHSEDFYRSARAAGKPVQLKILKDMGHQGNLWFPANFREILPMIDNFLKTDCGMAP
jgi:dipeptidyl aminopeptidase/acylaminoacyl peptidase